MVPKVVGVVEVLLAEDVAPGEVQRPMTARRRLEAQAGLGATVLGWAWQCAEARRAERHAVRVAAAGRCHRCRPMTGGSKTTAPMMAAAAAQAGGMAP